MASRVRHSTALATPLVQAAPRQAQGLLTVDELVRLHRHTWLRDAEATLMMLDWRAYSGGRTLHVLDAQAIGGPPHGYLGFTASAQLHELAADLLPFSRATTPAAAVAVNVDALVTYLRPALVAQASSTVLFDTLRAAVAAVAAHELAHVLEAQASGRRLHASATLHEVLASLSDGRAFAQPHQATSHTPGWLRAYGHLVTRASRLPRHDLWVASFERDVRQVLPHQPGDYLEALHPELARCTVDDQLIDILRTPAPAGFMALFNEWGAAQPAKEEV
jgi:hypothetical protein